MPGLFGRRDNFQGDRGKTKTLQQHTGSLILLTRSQYYALSQEAGKFYSGFRHDEYQRPTWRQGKTKTNTQAKTYNTGDSPVVTDLSTSPAVANLSRGERTGSRISWCLWSYVVVMGWRDP